MSFHFDPVSHTYTLNGRAVPSVTQVIKPLQDFSGIPPAVLEKKRAYGVAVHDVVARALAGTLDFGEVPEEVTGALNAFWRWASDNPEISAALDTAIVERPMVHTRLHYAGTPDLVLDGSMVIDLKTRPPKPLIDAIQCAAYEDLWKANGGTKTQHTHFILYLMPDGTYKFVRVRHKDAMTRFRHLLEIHRMMVDTQNWRP